MGGYRAKHSKQGYGCYADLSPCLQEFLEILSHPPLPGTKRETLLQMEISLISVNASYKRVISTEFSELFLYLLFLKNNVTELRFSCSLLES